MTDEKHSTNQRSDNKQSLQSNQGNRACTNRYVYCNHQCSCPDIHTHTANPFYFSDICNLSNRCSSATKICFPIGTLLSITRCIRRSGLCWLSRGISYTNRFNRWILSGISHHGFCYCHLYLSSKESQSSTYRYRHAYCPAALLPHRNLMVCPC